MVFGVIILAVAVLVAYLLNKSKVSEVKTEAPEKIEPITEEVVETLGKKAKTAAKKKTVKTK
jgi:hypothetical protein